MRHRIVIKQPAITRNATGAAEDDLTIIDTIWANVSIINGRERWANEHTLNEYDAAITIRYRSDLTEDMQAHHEGTVYEIKSIIDPFGNKSELKLLCTNYG